MEYKKYVLFLSTGFCGMDTAEAYLVPESTTQKELDAFAWQRAIEHAETYGIYPYPDDYEDYEDDEYSDDIQGYFVEYNEDKHKGHVTYGSAKEPDWQYFA
jgi:hypothetical protein